jgi:hypothetical protein
VEQVVLVVEALEIVELEMELQELSLLAAVAVVGEETEQLLVVVPVVLVS